MKRESEDVGAMFVVWQALNTSLRDQMEDLQQKQQQEEDTGFKPSELKKRLRKFTHDFKTNKVQAPFSAVQFLLILGTECVKS